MKLSAKINYILLPVMLVIFSTAALFSYSSQKLQLTLAMSDKLQNELEYISYDLNKDLQELDTIVRMSLESHHIQQHFYRLRNDTDKYYLEKELVNYINQLEINHGSFESFALLDNKGQEIIYFNTSNPFSKFETNEVIENHISQINNELEAHGVALINASTYKFIHRGDEPEFLILKTFTPEQSLTVPTFSRGHKLFTAVIRSKVTHNAEFYEKIRAKIDPDVRLSITPNTASNSIESAVKIDHMTASDDEFGYELKHDLWTIKIALTAESLSKIYKPFQILFVTIVLSVTLVTFVLLKWLIVKQIIKPVEKLTKQIEQVDSDNLIYIEKSKSDDEVSILTNKYINLISELDDLAKRDSLTGLPNRKKFNLDIVRIIDRCEKTDKKCAVIYFDLDNFKHVNDKYGHHIGDNLLSVFAERFVESFVDFDWDNLSVSEFEFARLSGDEFAIIVGGIDDLDILTLFTHRILSLFDGGFAIDDTLFDIGVSVGLSIYPNDAQTVMELINHADSAMYSSKKEFGRNNYRFYSDELNSEIKRHEKINEYIKDSISSNHFYLTYMPIYDTNNGKIRGAEVLLRTTHKDLSSYGPAEFIPVAESSGLIKDIDYWVFENALYRLSIWIKELNFDGVLAINFSSWQLTNIDFVDDLASLIDKYQIPPDRIEMEITETCFIPGDDQNIEMLKSLKKLGVRISLDDFGTGFTAFSQLINYPIDTLKIDRMFINAIDIESTDRQLFDVIIEMAKIYNLNVVAEGVETTTQLDYVRSKGCQEVQGFLLSKPLKEEDFLAIWKKQPRA